MFLKCLMVRLLKVFWVKRFLFGFFVRCVCSCTSSCSVSFVVWRISFDEMENGEYGASAMCTIVFYVGS